MTTSARLQLMAAQTGMVLREAKTEAELRNYLESIQDHLAECAGEVEALEQTQGDDR